MDISNLDNKQEDIMIERAVLMTWLDALPPFGLAAEIPGEFESLSSNDIADIILAGKGDGLLAAIQSYCGITGEISVSLSVAEWLTETLRWLRSE